MMIDRLGIMSCVLVAITFGTTPGLYAEPAATQNSDSISIADARELLEDFCADCHGDSDPEGGVDVTVFETADDLVTRHQLIRRVLAQLQTNSMPPDDPMPIEESRQLISWIETTLADADWEQVSDPAAVALPRLTLDEYTNTVRDLLGVDVDFTRVLADDPIGTSGFANDRASLLMTDNHLQRYMECAQLAVDTLFESQGDALKAHFEAEDVKLVINEITKPTHELEDGTVGFNFRQARGVKYQQVSTFLEFPKTGTYKIRIRAKTTRHGPRGGLWLALDNIDEMQRDGNILVKGDAFDVYEVSMFVTAGHHELLIGYDFDGTAWLPTVPDLPQRKLPVNRDEVIDKVFQSLDVKDVTWDEITKQRGFGSPTDTEIKRAKELIEQLNRNLLDDSIRAFELVRIYRDHNFLPVNQPSDMSYLAPEVQKELSALTGVSEEAIADLWKSHLPDRHLENMKIRDDLVKDWSRIKKDRDTNVGNVFVDWFEIEGPVVADPERANQLVAFAGTDKRIDRDRLSHDLSGLLPQAFRREVTDADIEPLLAFYDSERAAGTIHEIAVRRMLVAVLMSPHFLYRPEQAATKDGVSAINDEQLASRLSYFLWSTMPDEKLSRLAMEKKLRNAQTLDGEMERMIADERLLRLCRTFTDQWLGLGSIGRDKIPDTELFREFSWHLAEDMRTEVALQFQRLVVEDRSIIELLDCRETYLNERLARLYGIEDISGDELRSVSLDDRRRGGLLGTGAVLTATSLATRTSPVQRGKFVLETLLGEEMPPPPEDAGTLDEEAGQRENKTLREELAAHRDNPSCIGCHQRIDPLGFGLESFDFVGRWRTKTPGGTVDARGELTDGTQFDGIVELKEYLVEQQADAFARNLTQRLLSYALGRRLDYYDEAEVQRIVAIVKENDYRAQTLIREIVHSKPFRFQHFRQTSRN